MPKYKKIRFLKKRLDRIYNIYFMALDERDRNIKENKNTNGGIICDRD